MEKTNYTTGWTTKAWVEIKSQSTYGFIKEWMCDTSGDPLEEECLLVKKMNFKHRGKETDQLHKYNRSSTPEKYKQAWQDWDNIKALKSEEIKLIAKRYNISLTPKKP